MVIHCVMRRYEGAIPTLFHEYCLTLPTMLGICTIQAYFGFFLFCHLQYNSYGVTMLMKTHSVSLSLSLSLCDWWCSGDDSIRVFVRVRPPDPNLEGDLDHAHCVDVTSATSLGMQSRPEPKVFTFDHVAGMHTTQVCTSDTCVYLHVYIAVLCAYSTTVHQGEFGVSCLQCTTSITESDQTFLH